jgi:tryptophan-rich sensory protein
MKNIPTLALSFLLCFAAAGLGGYFNSFGLGPWYDSLIKPSWNPPSWVFGPVWTLLYTMMAVSLWLVWCRRKESDVTFPVGLFLLHLVLNAGWSGIFFALHRPDWAFIEIVLLWFSILALITIFKPIDNRASYLLIPYLGWVTFASVLNGTIAYLNR